MPNRNIGNVEIFDNLLVNQIDILNGFNIIGTSSTPVFNVDTATDIVSINGSLNVSGNVTFNQITISEFQGGLLNIGNSNIADVVDLGINGKYVLNSITTYSGIVRDASDTLQRWTFYDNITSMTPSSTTVETISSATLAPIRASAVYLNDGSATAPSYTFDSDISYDTGFYRAAENAIGITAGGKNVVTISRSSNVLSNFSLNSDTQFGIPSLNTVDDSILSNAISTGHIYLASTNANDKWLSLYSATTSATPSYSGTAFSSPANHYFVSNIGSGIRISGRINSGDTATQAPDYRIANTELLDIGLTTIESKVPVTIPLGTLGNLAIQFSNETTTGIYRPSANEIGLVCSSTNILNVTALGITASRNIYNIDGTVSSPAVSFTNSQTSGIYSSAVNVVNITANGVNRATFNSAGTSFDNGSIVNVGTSGATSILNVYGVIEASDGTVAAPGIAFMSNTGQNTGLYRIGFNNIGITTGGSKRIDISDTATAITNDFQLQYGFKKTNIVSSTTSITLDSSYYMLETSATTPVTVTLPTIVGNTGREYIIIRIGGGTGTVTINTNSLTEYIDNQINTSVTLQNQYDRVTLLCGSTQWYSI